MTQDGFFLDYLHRVHTVTLVGKSDSLELGWFDLDRGSYIETVVTEKQNLFTNEEAAKKAAFLRLLKNKETK